jgi:O-acetyl-ADP-ribose deacetylase
MNSNVEFAISFVIGDITEQRVDAVVNAANTDLLLGSGVAGAIRRAGGPAIQEECNRLAPIPLGEAAITGGGNLPAPWVIHAAGMHLSGGVSAQSCADATRHSLQRAAEKGLQSLAFPAIGTGVGGLGMAECARVMLGEVNAHWQGESSVERVVFVLSDAAAHAVFERTWNDIRGTAG